MTVAAAYAARHFYLKSAEPSAERIGAALRKAIALLEMKPPVPALKSSASPEPAPELFDQYIDRLARIRVGDISAIKRELPSAINAFEVGDGSESTAIRAVAAAHGPHSKALIALDEWVRQDPASYAALLSRGIVYSSLGWHWRGGDYIPYTPKENLVEMTRFHILATDDLVPALSKTRYPVMAIAQLIGIAKAHGWKEEAKKLYMAGEQLCPSSDELFTSYQDILYTEWGSGSISAAKAFLRRAEENGVSIEARSGLMRQLINIESGYRFAIGKPDALPHAVEFSERVNTIDAWWWRSKVETSLDLHEASLKSLLRVAAKYPSLPAVMADITWVLLKLDRQDDYKLALRRTADLGSDWAQGQIIANMIWERHGEKRDWAKIRKECEDSAEMLNPSGENCIGGLYFEALGGYPKDHARAIAYFELAARQGNERAQHDYGWMLIQGMGVPSDREKGIFYVRNSARQKFEPALEKLKQLGERTDNLEWKISPSEDAKRKMERLLDRGDPWQGRH